MPTPTPAGAGNEKQTNTADSPVATEAATDTNRSRSGAIVVVSRHSSAKDDGNTVVFFFLVVVVVVVDTVTKRIPRGDRRSRAERPWCARHAGPPATEGARAKTAPPRPLLPHHPLQPPTHPLTPPPLPPFLLVSFRLAFRRGRSSPGDLWFFLIDSRSFAISNVVVVVIFVTSILCVAIGRFCVPVECTCHVNCGLKNKTNTNKSGVEKLPGKFSWNPLGAESFDSVRFFKMHRDAQRCRGPMADCRRLFTDRLDQVTLRLRLS